MLITIKSTSTFKQYTKSPRITWHLSINYLEYVLGNSLRNIIKIVGINTDKNRKAESLLVAISGDEKLSIKGHFITQLFRSSSNFDILLVFKNTENKTQEKWSSNQVFLRTSIFGIFIDLLLTGVNSPANLGEIIIQRLHHKPVRNLPTNDGFLGFLSAISQALSLSFAKSGKIDGLMRFLSKSNSRVVFLVDQFVSLNFIELKKLKKLGPIIYVSQDLGYNHFSFADNRIAKRLVYKLEKEAVPLADLVIACSEMEKLKYLEMGAKKAIFYPNIYPITEFEPCEKDEVPSICIVLPKHWGSKVETDLAEIFKALSYINTKIKVYMIGIKPKDFPKNVKLQYFEFIETRFNYLKILSKSWIGINIGIHLGGTNQKKYDFAMAGLVVFSDTLGARGDLLPHEYVYVDRHDLAAKLMQLLRFNRQQIKDMGVQNRKQALLLSEKYRKELLSAIRSTINIEEFE